MTFVCAAAASLAAQSARAPERVYAAAMHQSVWYAQSSAHLCELSHPVPLYGMARFRHAAERPLQFELSVHTATPQQGFVQLRSEHPRWNHLDDSTSIARVSVEAGHTPVRLPEGLALRLLLELENGRQPTFRYGDENRKDETTIVQLSNVNFAEAMDEFRYCVGRLGGSDAVAIARVEVRFALNSAALDRRERPHLSRVAEKIAADPGISRIVLTGYADRSGRSGHNYALSQRRARSVLDYLIGQGVEKSLFEIVAMGESAATPDAAVAAAQRQVTVELLR